MNPRISYVYVVLPLLLATSFCNAATISLQPSTATLAVGDVISLDVVLDFGADRPIGGGLDFYWDPAVLDFSGWTFDTNTIMDDLQFRRFGDLYDGRYQSVAVGSFDGVDDGIMGTISFEALAEGSATILTTDSGGIGGPTWIAFADFHTPINVDFVGADITVTGAVVPVPATAWLLLGALGALTRVRRKA